MKKIAFQDQATTVTINGYLIHTFSFSIGPDPDNLNDGARLMAQYDLGNIDAVGKFAPSALPQHRGLVLNLYNVGTDLALTDWLRGSQEADDLFSFDYHDVERLVESDIEKRFGIEVKK